MEHCVKRTLSDFGRTLLFESRLIVGVHQLIILKKKITKNIFTTIIWLGIKMVNCVRS